MGYYSEVIIVLDQKAQAELKILLEQEGEGSYYTKLFTEEIDETQLSSKKDILYAWNYIKWYPEEEEFFERLTKKLEAHNYYFARLGEEYGDFEDDGSLLEPWCIYPQQNLEIQLP